jgi:hypothetical protein
MTAAFAAAVDALFADPNIGEDALWKPAGVGGAPIRVIRKTPDRIVDFGASRALMSSMLLDVRRSEAPTVAEGDLIEVGTEMFKVIAPPIADSLGLVLTCEAVIV